MRFPVPARALALFVTLVPAAFGQQIASAGAPVQRDPEAIAALVASVKAMGPLPADSTATGTLDIVEGSTAQSGTIQILTRGATQTAETITLGNAQRAVTYSNGDAKESNGVVVR